MIEFILNSILWTLAIYGLIEIIKTVLHIFKNRYLKTDGIYIIIAVKNQSDKVEGFLRSFLFRILYGKEENIKDIIITDLGSTDETPIILDKLQNEYSNIKIANWDECKDVIENISN